MPLVRHFNFPKSPRFGSKKTLTPFETNLASKTCFNEELGALEGLAGIIHKLSTTVPQPSSVLHRLRCATRTSGSPWAPRRTP